MYNILTDQLIRTDTSGGSRVEASLPEVYAALMVNEVEAFPTLRPHQRHAWHAFLVQLGAMAMHEAGLSDSAVRPDGLGRADTRADAGLPRRRTLAARGRRYHEARLHAAARILRGQGL